MRSLAYICCTAACSLPSLAQSDSSCLVYSFVWWVFFFFSTWSKIERPKKKKKSFLVLISAFLLFSHVFVFPFAMILLPATCSFLCFCYLSQLGLFLAFYTPGFVPGLHEGQVSVVSSYSTNMEPAKGLRN